MDLEQWADRFERERLPGKMAMLGGAAVRLSAGLIDRGLSRAAATVAEAGRAFGRELDPNIEDAKILEERTRDD